MSQPTESAPRADGRRTARRDEILTHAMRLFREDGVHAVSTRHIAAAVGISQPSLYAHFPTKQSLVAAACVGAFEALAAAMREASQADDAAFSMARLARVYIDFGLNHSDAYRVAFMLEGIGPNTADEAMSAGLACFEVHREAVARSVGPHRSQDEVDLLAQSSWAALHGLVSLLIARPEFPWTERERLIERHIRLATAEF